MTPALCSLPDLLVFLPYHVGFHLDDSLVIVAVLGSRLDLVERVDLPEQGALDLPTRVRLVSGLRRRRPTSILVAAYARTRDPLPTLETLTEEIADTVGPARSVLVRGGRWAEWPGEGHHADTCTPIRRRQAGVGWRDLPDAAEVPLVAEFVGRGVAPFGSRDALTAALAPAPDQDLASLVRLRGRPRPLEALSAWDRLCAGGSAPADLVTVLASLAEVADRDRLLTHLVPVTGGESRARHPVDQDPDPWEERVRIRSALIRLARAAPHDLRSAALSVLAVWAWDVGDGALARIAVDLALVADPGYSLAGLVAQLVQYDIRPPAA